MLSFIVKSLLYFQIIAASGDVDVNSFTQEQVIVVVDELEFLYTLDENTTEFKEQVEKVNDIIIGVDDVSGRN